MEWTLDITPLAQFQYPINLKDIVHFSPPPYHPGNMSAAFLSVVLLMGVKSSVV